MVQREAEAKGYSVKSNDQLTPDQHVMAQSMIGRRVGIQSPYSDLHALLDPTGSILAALAYDRENRFIVGIAQTANLRKIAKSSNELRPTPRYTPRSPAEVLLLHVLLQERANDHLPIKGHFTAQGSAMLRRLKRKYCRHGLRVVTNQKYTPQKSVFFQSGNRRPIALVASADWR